MSIKMYDGLKMINPERLWDLQNFLTEHYSVEKMRIEINKLTEEIVFAYDRYHAGIMPPYFKENSVLQGPLEELINTAKLKHFIDGEAISSQLKSKDPDPSLDAVGVFLNRKRNEIYLYPYFSDYTITNKLMELMLQEGWVEEYGYWNNSDHPEYLTQEQWEDRIKSWEEAVNLNKPLGSQGMQIVLEDSYSFHLYPNTYKNYVLNPDNVFEVPSRAKREHVLAQNILGQEFMTAGNNNPNDLISYMFDRDNIRKKIPQIAHLIQGFETKEEYVLKVNE